jgi:hypothetical protein
MQEVDCNLLMLLDLMTANLPAVMVLVGNQVSLEVMEDKQVHLDTYAARYQEHRD